MATAAIVQRTQVTEFFIRAIWAVISAITKFLCRQADGGVVGTHMVRELTHQRLTVVLIRVVLTVTVAITNPGFADTACRVPATKLDSWITHVCDTLTVFLITRVHAVSVPITAPPHGDAKAIQTTLKLICMTTTRWTRGLIGAVCMGLIAVVPTVIISITGPVIWDASSAVTLELSAGAGVTATGLITVVPTVVIIITAPVNVDTASVVAGELSEGKTGGVGARSRFI